MLRKIFIPLFILIMIINLAAEGYANGRNPKWTKQNKKLTVVRSATRNQIKVRVSPPAPQLDVIPVRPFPHAVWIPGHWTWDYRLQTWIWVAGYWDLHPMSTVWISGYWQEQSGVWIWVEGRWF